MKLDRSCGLLLHITSLPGPYGGGSLGEEAYKFADFLADSGQRYWQILPHNPVCGHLGYSPYLSPSTFAGNPLMISLEKLSREKWVPAGIIPEDTFTDCSDFSDFKKKEDLIYNTMRELYSLFINCAHQDEQDKFRSFCDIEAWWLNDYALFSAFSESFRTMEWTKWPVEIARRDPSAIQQATETMSQKISFHKFVQFIFDTQWKEWKAYCNTKGVQIIGDLPIYVGFDSADGWVDHAIFQIDETTLSLTDVAGVPPDYFSPTGQRWGNPLYRWKDKAGKLNDEVVRWWIKRMKKYYSFVDMIRIDHFRAFANYWSIPVEEETAVKGKWMEGPGIEFFSRIRSEVGDIQCIAEDLGMITPSVEKLRDDAGFPGMKILQFAFDGNPKNTYLPHNIENSHCVVYTGTHDNDTTNGWYYNADLSDDYRQIIKKYLRFEENSEFHWKLITYAYATSAKLVIIPAQDILGYGREFRMNIPGKADGNWKWKLTPDRFNKTISDKLSDLAYVYNRHTNQRAEDLIDKEKHDLD